ncbi:MAG: DUF1540 domain-containing protein [Chloroflexi bacterium]|nr:DUF1540 domain-containing protein [Chloroflexota bacterium]
MEMIQIKKCDVSVCVYNKQNMCHTFGITVGSHAECNTYNHGSQSGGFDGVTGGVGACLAADCKFNDQLECRAPAISVEGHSVHADCATFERRK